MSTITRRSLILSGAGLATAAFVVPAEAATGAVSLHIASAGFIFGVTGGSGTFTFRGQQFPRTVGGVSGGAARISGVSGCRATATLGCEIFPLRVGGISSGSFVGFSATDLVGTAFN